MNLPELFENRMKSILGDEYKEYIKSYEKQRIYGLRVNTSKISTEKFEQICPFQITKIPWISNGYYYDGKEQPSKHPFYYAGLYYLQEPSAMTPASRLEIHPGDKVLDLCAAPGGKATELGARLMGEGVLIANDISNSRAKALLKNIELFGIANVFVVSESPDKLLNTYTEYFDKILLDAPCSGEGMFRKEPSMIKEWEEKGPEYYAKIQQELIIQAAKMLKPGGMMLYSTCTFSPEENEATIQYLLEQEEQFELVEMAGYEGFAHGKPECIDGDMQLTKCVRIWPHKMEGEGHFLALLHKKGESIAIEREVKHTVKDSKEYEAVQDFLKDVSMNWKDGSIEIKDQRVYYIPKDTEIKKGIRFLRTGLFLGEVKKNRFEPSQALAMAIKAEQFSSIVNLEHNDIRVVKYLKGETLDVSDILIQNKSGWQLVCVNNYPLGWGKLSNGVLKNKYYAGWRWQ
jgi:NOL1/NOP2/sun family putative RNA methylase